MDFVQMTHPDLDTTVTVPASSVETHKAAGWQLVEDESAAAPVAPKKGTSSSTKSTRTKQTSEED